MASKLSPLLAAILLLSLSSWPQPILSKSVHVDHGEVAQQNPFQFIQHLVGCHKGETQKGLHDLKLYLAKFGYLHYNHSKDDRDDSFDDLLESAIKTYQLNYHLNVTGMVDTKTAQQMMMPRCGDADIVNGTSSMRSGKKRHLGSTTLHTVSHYSFFQGNPRWPSSKTHLTYGFLPEGVRVTSMQDLSLVCSRAFARWSDVSHFTFEEIDDYSSADIQIGFFSGDHGDNSEFDGPGGTLAHAYPPTIGLFHYDADESWAINNPGPTEFDLESLAVHEIGHLLGLHHSSVSDAIMFPTFFPGVKKADLHGDDVQGIRALYNL